MILTSESDLRRKSLEVTLEEGEAIAKQLFKELEKSDDGVGLSASQIGILSRVIVFQASNKPKALINPRIIELEQPFVNMREGCLSFSGVWINTIRFHNVIVEDDLHGRREYNSFGSVVIQHELDHLDGILFFDRKAPKRYEDCFCGSKKKFKFCCYEKVL